MDSERLQELGRQSPGKRANRKSGRFTYGVEAGGSD
jgi:hypothetical protein